MRHLSEEELILHYYGERDEAGGHLAGCHECRQRLAELISMLSAIQAPGVPPRDDNYGTEVWSRIRPHLAEAKAKFLPWWQMPRRWALVGAVALLVVVAFLAGRFSPGRKPEPSPSPVANNQQVQERILLVALGDHLDRSQMLLVELTHAPASPKVDLATEQQRASDLVAANRLYRQAAERIGDTGTAAVLDQLERLLVEIAHQPSTVSDAQLEQLRRQIESEGLLFKVRVIRSNVLSDAQSPSVHNVESPVPTRPTL